MKAALRSALIQPRRSSGWSQALIRIVCTKPKAIFGAAREHPVRLATDSTCDEVVDHNPDVRFARAEGSAEPRKSVSVFLMPR